jgi:hypothetical protein
MTMGRALSSKAEGEQSKFFSYLHTFAKFFKEEELFLGTDY